MKNFTPVLRFLAITSVACLSSMVISCGGTPAENPAERAPIAERKPAAETPGPYVVKDVPGGRIEGRVTLKGKPPLPQKILVSQDQDVCGTERMVYPVRVNQGGVVDAVLWIPDIRQGKPFDFPPTVLDQKKCVYTPHLMLVEPGALTVQSSDPIPHNVHTYAEANRTYNESMNPLRRTVTLQLSRPERVEVRCDLHRFMKAYVTVAQNPYYVLTTADGTFSLDRVPAGRYQLKVWQEALGELEQEVAVEAGKTTKVDFSFESN